MSNSCGTSSVSYFILRGLGHGNVPWLPGAEGKGLVNNTSPAAYPTFKAEQRGNTRAVQKLQKLLMKSEAARLLAVRRVSQDNQGKKTAGVDGVKSLKPQQRKQMAQLIHPKQWPKKAQPVRRVHIPKPGKDEQRALGIPTMYERGRQCLVKLALEPEWEARFENNSYGFRPGRSCHDAIEAIFSDICQKARYVFDADIRGCFDNGLPFGCQMTGL